MTTYQALLQNPDFKKKSILEALIKEYTGLTREDIRTHLEEEIESWILTKILNGYHEYTEEKKPLEYILGHVDFFGKEFYVNEHTIIPRPETEYMVRAVSLFCHPEQSEGSSSIWLKLDSSAMPQNDNWIKKQPFTLLDIGTWSGILGISIILQNPNTFSQVFLSDISEKALEVAKKNWNNLVENYTGEVHFLKSNLAESINTQSFWTKWQHFILVANLPYIPDETFDTNALENVQKREPRLAFVGGNDGLDLYRTMFKQIKSLNPESKISNLTMFLEMMTRQVEVLRKEFDWLEFEEVETFHFNIRIVKAAIINH